MKSVLKVTSKCDVLSKEHPDQDAFFRRGRREKTVHGAVVSLDQISILLDEGDKCVAQEGLLRQRTEKSIHCVNSVQIKKCLQIFFLVTVESRRHKSGKEALQS